MDNNKIESNGITALENFLSESEILVPKIPKGDKYPLWDGEILVYKFSKQSNENLKGRVPVQVKSSRTKAFDATKKTFSLEILDLENYSRDGGIIFIRPIFISTTQYEIYYKLLLPRDISLLLADKVENQQLKSFELSRVESFADFENLCNHFLANNSTPIQSSFGESIIKNRDLFNNFLVKTIVKKGEEPIKSIISELAYIYIETKDGSPLLTNLQIENISNEIKNSVSIDGIEFFKSIRKVIDNDGNDYIYFNSVLYLEINKDNKKIRINLNNKPESLYYDYLQAIKFLKKFKETKSFNIENESFPVKINKINLKKEFNSEYEYLLEIEKIFEMFRVNTNKITLKDLNANSKILNDLIHFFNIKSPIKIEGDREPIISKIFNLINRKIIILFKKLKESEYIALNYYSDDLKGQFTIQHEISKEWITCSRFLPLLFGKGKSLKNIEIIDNFFDIVKNDLIEYYDSGLFDYYNQFMLYMISGYDLTKNIEYLKLSETINELSNEEKDYINNPIYFINKLQIKKRFEVLEKKEKIQLIEIKKKYSQNKQLICCVLILLESLNEFELEFDTFNDVEKDIFKSWPIWNLYWNFKNSSQAKEVTKK